MMSAASGAAASPGVALAATTSACGSGAFDFVVCKQGRDEILGMDVRSIECGKLEVTQIFAEGAVARANVSALTRCPPGTALQAGDIIHRVNAVSGAERDMVAECKLADILLLLCTRPAVRGAAVAVPAAVPAPHVPVAYGGAYPLQTAMSITMQPSSQ